MKIAVCIFSSAVIKKYANEIVAIESTWAKLCQKHSVEYFFFLGKENPDFTGKQFVYLPFVEDTYESASIKQWKGIKHITKNCSFDFVFVCGSDTFLNVKNLLSILSPLDPDDCLYIGGHGDTRAMIGFGEIYFHSGGAGFVLSRAACKLLTLVDDYYPLYDKWKQVCGICAANDLIPACDVAMGFYASQMGITVIKHEGFWHCNYFGFPCHQGIPDKKKLISCHNMLPGEMREYYNLIQQPA